MGKAKITEANQEVKFPSYLCLAKKGTKKKEKKLELKPDALFMIVKDELNYLQTSIDSGKTEAGKMLDQLQVRNSLISKIRLLSRELKRLFQELKERRLISKEMWS